MQRGLSGTTQCLEQYYMIAPWSSHIFPLFLSLTICSNILSDYHHSLQFPREWILSYYSIANISFVLRSTLSTVPQYATITTASISTSTIYSSSPISYIFWSAHNSSILPTIPATTNSSTVPTTPDTPTTTADTNYPIPIKHEKYQQ